MANWRQRSGAATASVWDYAFDPNDNVIDKHIHRLRRKLDEGFDHSLIRTVPGAGYSLEVNPAQG